MLDNINEQAGEQVVGKIDIKPQTTSDKVTTDEFLIAVVEQTVTGEMFQKLDLYQKSYLADHHKELYTKLLDGQNGIGERDFLEVAGNTKDISIEKYLDMSESQKALFKRLDYTTWEKMENYYNNYTVEDFSKMSLSERQLMYKTNQQKYIELNEENQELTAARGNLLDQTQTYYRMMKAKGMKEDTMKAINDLINTPLAVKYHVKFDAAVKKVLSEDAYTLGSMTKEAFRGKVEAAFRNSLPLAAFNISR